MSGLVKDVRYHTSGTQRVLRERIDAARKPYLQVKQPEPDELLAAHSFLAIVESGHDCNRACLRAVLDYVASLKRVAPSACSRRRPRV